MTPAARPGQPTVLLTGSRGFTGVHLRRHLELAGYRVVGLVRADPALHEVTGDLASPASLVAAIDRIQPDAVIHLAGIASATHADPLDYYRVNVLGTLNLLETLAASGLPFERVVLASSAAIYGNRPVPRIPEGAIPAPANHYAASKLAMEHLARPFLDRLPLVIVRPFNYTGPGQLESYVAAKIAGHFRRRERTLRLGNLHVSREVNDIRTIVSAYRGILEHVPAGTTVNLCSGVGVSLFHMIEVLTGLTGHHINVEVDPRLVRVNELPHLVGDPAYLDGLLPGLPRRTLEETLRSLLDPIEDKQTLT